MLVKSARTVSRDSGVARPSAALSTPQIW